MSTAIEPRSSNCTVTKGWLWTERLAWVGGIAAVGLWSLLSVSGAMGARRELQRFAAFQSAAALGESTPDQRLWSAARVLAWRDTEGRQSPVPLAVLRVPGIGLEVAVLEGTDDWTLNRAVGRIEGTANPGEAGNSGIAGHRDGFFRGLKDVRAGDALEIETRGAVHHYRVERTWIVQPDDVSVLDPTEVSAVTLVTCYPFYFVGSAPQRFIVRAVRIAATAPHQSVNVQ
jgi:sortase A